VEEVKPLIMIVDDEPEIVRVVQLILEDEGYKVWTANNGQSAFERLEAGLARRREYGVDDNVKYLPDLILSDVMMPVMNGYEFYERTRGHPALNHIPFIFLTAKSDEVEIRRGKELGADDYLTKPTPPEDLLASVKGKLRRVSQRRSLMLQFTGDVNKPPMMGVVLVLAFVVAIVVVTIIVTWLLMG